jgi:hypothetical protein
VLVLRKGVHRLLAEVEADAANGQIHRH